MLFAKTSKSASRISEQIRKRTIKKRYLAVAEGNTPENGMLQDYLLKNNKTNSVSVVSRGNKKAQKAELIYQKLKSEEGLSLLKITLITGRPHQIRVQLSHLGYPIFGDRKYGSKHPNNIALHSSELTFTHPTDKKKITIHSKPPTQAPWDIFDIS